MAKKIASHVKVLLPLLILPLTNSSLPFNHSTTHERHKDESTALLQFKHNFVINNFASHNPSSYPKTVSWIPSWHGVECDEVTGHVIGIDLSSSQLYGSLDPNSSLFQLRHLQELDLSDNDSNNPQIPARLCELSQLPESLSVQGEYIFW
ncbi:hypothetical protein PIB30_082074 [Stylosanthes scabra]|uniref:Leucine-rich repeat-containing N-terminal plant-type domain-containing protein n=1 Tax=Stylosanthes scabra TaxID=79078 RepID=A0ABU6TU40_9FABA|nr:hypothetical protein [Stylosanthes scabra]